MEEFIFKMPSCNGGPNVTSLSSTSRSSLCAANGPQFPFSISSLVNNAVLLTVLRLAPATQPQTTTLATANNLPTDLIIDSVEIDAVLFVG